MYIEASMLVKPDSSCLSSSNPLPAEGRVC